MEDGVIWQTGLDRVCLRPSMPATHDDISGDVGVARLTDGGGTVGNRHPQA